MHAKYHSPDEIWMLLKEKSWIVVVMEEYNIVGVYMYTDFCIDFLIY